MKQFTSPELLQAICPVIATFVPYLGSTGF
jgi:hypothetical protein